MSDGEQPRDHHYESTICEVWHGNNDAPTLAAHIAAFSPATVLKLLALAEVGQARIEHGGDIAAHLEALTAAGYTITLSKPGCSY